MHTITNLWKFELNWSSKLRDNNERKNTLVTQSSVRLDGWFRDLKSEVSPQIWGLEIKFVENYFFLENYVTSEGAVYHNVLYNQSLPITRHQVRLYADNYFEQLPIVSTAFNVPSPNQLSKNHAKNDYSVTWTRDPMD